MKAEWFDYDLPEEAIAQRPVTPRDGSRLFALNRKSGYRRHLVFRDLPLLLQPGDLLVLNDTRVMPARLLGEKTGTGGAVELLLLNRRSLDTWEALVRPGRRLKPGASVTFGDGLLKGEIVDETEEGGRIVRFDWRGGTFEELLHQLGRLPLPPYIKEGLKDPDRYQTVYARDEGSNAAPTAGLHFTEELLDTVVCQGIQVAKITLHVGLGTFRPVTAERVDDHRMHAEWYRVSADAAQAISETKAAGGRVIAVGTTVVRTLESLARNDGSIQPGEGWTDIFIYPGYRFKTVDAIVTNFHLPKSTLLMLVCAFAGRDLILDAYREAIDEGYRFFSFGDAMFVY